MFLELAICVVINLSVFNANLERDKNSFFQGKTHKKVVKSIQIGLFLWHIQKSAWKNRLFENFARQPALLCRATMKSAVRQDCYRKV